MIQKLLCWLEILAAMVAIRTPWRWRYLNAVSSANPCRRDHAVWRVMWEVSLHHIKPVTCLEYAAALHRMLKRRGVECELRFGVRESGRLAAHAWVELPDGTRLEEQQPEHLAMGRP